MTTIDEMLAEISARADAATKGNIRSDVEGRLFLEKEVEIIRTRLVVSDPPATDAHMEPYRDIDIEYEQIGQVSRTDAVLFKNARIDILRLVKAVKEAVANLRGAESTQAEYGLHMIEAIMNGNFDD